MKLSRIRFDGAKDLHGVVAACFDKGAGDYWSACGPTITGTRGVRSEVLTMRFAAEA